MNHTQDYFDYDTAWKEVTILIDKNQLKSAEKIVNDIYQQAKEDRNEVQYTKAVIYTGNLKFQTEEKGLELTIDYYEKELKTSWLKSPYINILQSQLGIFYKQYFDNNRYEISQRTDLDLSEDSNIRSMSSQHFIRRIDSLLFASIVNKSDLDRPVEEFKPLLASEKYTSLGLQLRPKLYDLLAWEVMNYLAEGDLRPTLPSSTFTINNEAYLSPAQSYVKLDIKSDDPESTLYKSLLLYQQMLRSHSPNTEAYHDIDLKRLEFVYRNANLGKGEELYLLALENKLKLISKIEFAEINTAAKIVEIWSNKPDYESKSKAALLCLKLIQKYQDGDKTGIFANTLDQLNASSLSSNMGNVFGTNVTPKLHLTYTNLKDVTLSLYLLPYETAPVDLNDRNKGLPSSKKLVKEWTVNTHNDTAYITHTQAISMPKLPLGYYILKVKNAAISETSQVDFWVTNMRVITTKIAGRNDIYITDQEQGKPICDAKVEFWTKNYDYRTREWLYNKLSQTKTDKEGRAQGPSESNNYFIKVKNKNDHFCPNENVYSHRYQNERSRKSTELFTDRAIYRPGQTVYFKGLQLEYNAERIPHIVANEPMKVSIKDANYQIVKEMQVTTNEFGSFEGSFVVPMGQLTGTYTIETPNGSTNPIIEEYKRPTFEVTIDSLQGSPSLGDDVTLVGQAKGLAGQSVSNGKVQYTITRSLTYPWHCYWFPYPKEQQMMAVGEVQTDTQGAFRVVFDTKKEDTGPYRGIQYVYKVHVVVTDASGESRDINKVVHLLDTDYLLSVESTKEHFIDEPVSITTWAKNINGKPISTKVVLEVWAVTKVEQVVHNNGYYRGPSIVWKETNLIKQTSIDANETVTWTDLKPGNYKIKVNSKDSKGQALEDFTIIKVSSLKKKEIADGELVYLVGLEDSYEVGTTMEIHLASPNSKLYSRVVLMRGDKVLVEKWIKLNPTESIKYTITEADRGNLHLLVFSNKEEQVFTKNTTISVPWSNKTIDIKFASFRDKLEPGEREQYTITLQDKGGNLLDGEVLMTMYDASLDFYNKLYWNQSYYPSRYNNASVQFLGSRSSSGPYITNRKYIPYENAAIIYPSLLNFQVALMMIESRMYRGGNIPRPKMSKSSDATMMEDQMVDSAPIIQEVAEGEAQNTSSVVETKAASPDFSPRENLNETVFFYPQVQVVDGQATIDFTMNEAITKWRLMTLAHTRDMKVGYDERLITTSKDLLITANAPRFIKKGDELWFTARVSNMTNLPKEFNASLQLADYLSQEDIGNMMVESTNTVGQLAAQETQGAAWKILLPTDTDLTLLEYTVKVASGDKVDGERGILPVVDNKIPVYENQTIFISGGATKQMQFKALLDANNARRSNELLAFDFTSNPIWHAIQALPYVDTEDQKSTIGLINKYFINAVGLKALENNQIKRMIQTWATTNSDALQSNLSKNSELKYSDLKETPFLYEALDETQQKQLIVQYLQEPKLRNDLKQIHDKIMANQKSNGGFAWMEGMKDSPYITCYLLSEIAKLKDMRVDHPFGAMEEALRYIDAYVVDTYYKRVTAGLVKETYIPSSHDIEILKVRHSYPMDKTGEAAKIYDYYTSQAVKHWTKYNNYYTLSSLGRYLYDIGHPTYKEIKSTLIEKSFYSEELGRYYNTGNGYNWYELSIETHTAIMDFLSKAGTEDLFIDEMKIWLLKNKQVNRWNSTKGTAAAIYSLLHTKSQHEGKVAGYTNILDIKIGGKFIPLQQGESGTGYQKVTYYAQDINPSKAVIEIKNNSSHIAWAGAYYKYYDAGKDITAYDKGPLKIQKELYKKTASLEGIKLEKLTDKNVLQVGDELVSRIIIISDRDMEYIELKDMRGSGLEPMESRSGYQWDGIMGHYLSIRDLSNNYYFDYLPKGTYVFEQSQRVVHKGLYDGGIASIQSIYAPDFTSHSQGFEIEVK